MSGEHVVVAMSGGVDSSVAAALLVEQGYQVSGLMMRLWSEPGQFATQRDNRCCTRDQMIDAAFVARKLGIPFEMLDAQEVFRREVVDRFIETYERGETPNPCLQCNRHIRFTYLLNAALERGANYLATGHYARIERADDGLLQLHRGIDPAKDQSYVLSVLNQQQLGHAMFPVGHITKPEVRELALRFGLPVASKHDSQDLCFLADGDYRRFLRDHSSQTARPGPILRRDGSQIGQHEGLAFYTIGQRKGLGLSHAEPLYVIDKDIPGNALIVGERDELGATCLEAAAVSWISGQPPQREFRAEVQLRYKARAVPALIRPESATTLAIVLDDPLPDITPGQGAVLYSGTRVLGSGLIRRVSLPLASGSA